MVFSLGGFGNLIASTPLVLMVQAVGWRNAFLIIAGINLILTVLFYLIARDRPESSVIRDVPKAASTQIREIRSSFVCCSEKRIIGSFHSGHSAGTAFMPRFSLSGPLRF